MSLCCYFTTKFEMSRKKSNISHYDSTPFKRNNNLHLREVKTIRTCQKKYHLIFSNVNPPIDYGMYNFI